MRSKSIVNSIYTKKTIERINKKNTLLGISYNYMILTHYYVVIF